MPPDIICEEINLQAQVKWKVGGQRRSPNGKLLKGNYDSTYCSFDLKKTDDIDLLSFLKTWNDKLDIHKLFFEKIVFSGGNIEYFIGWYSDGNSGEIFDIELMKKLVALNINLSIDYYGPENK